MNRAVIIADLVTCYREGKKKYPNMVIDYAKLSGIIEQSGYNIFRKIGIGNQPSFSFVNFLKKEGYEVILECPNNPLIMALKTAEIITMNGTDAFIFFTEDPEIIPVLKYTRMMGKKTYVVCAEKNQFEKYAELILIQEDFLMNRKVEEANGT